MKHIRDAEGADNPMAKIPAAEDHQHEKEKSKENSSSSEHSTTKGKEEKDKSMTGHSKTVKDHDGHSNVKTRDFKNFERTF